MSQDENNLYAAPSAKVEEPEEPVDIDALAVSDTWKRRFKAMQKAGGPMMPKRNELSKEERKGLGPFNLLAFLFGPFYYFAKGMWKKGFLLGVLVVGVLLILDLIMAAVGFADFGNYSKFAGPAVFAAKANIDYYRTMVLRDRSWW